MVRASHRLFRQVSVVAVVVASGMSSVALAAPDVEIGGMAGVHVFSDTNELGVPDVPLAPSQASSVLFGVRIGALFGDTFGIEGELGVLPTVAREGSSSVWDLTYRAHLVAQFRAANPANKVVPFLVLGGGVFQVISSEAEDTIGLDVDEVFYAGGGAKYRIGNSWGVRGDARLLLPPSSENDGVTTDFELLLSIYKNFGHQEPKPVVDDDPDRDGIRGTADQCPAEPEDKDSFEDTDGCPDLDNDRDGVADAADRCPVEPEDMDGFQDDDGCPELDNDTDGIPDATDKCPIQAEDKDGFQDEDGCPDPDNDGDGVPDAQDACPTEQETKNGFKDEDGCPDELPTAIKNFTGVVKGINFKTNSADILASSNKTLDQAVAVLTEYKDLRLEIEGHTDDQPLGKASKFADNAALSQARADSVKAYMIKKGIAEDRVIAKGMGDSKPVVDPTGLKGGKLNAARAKNRRVEFQPISNLPAPAPTTPTP